MKAQNLILRTIYQCYEREKLGISISESEYVRTMSQTVEKTILTTVYIWKATDNPFYMNNRAYLEIAGMNLKVCLMRYHNQIGQVHNPRKRLIGKGIYGYPVLLSLDLNVR